MQALGRKGRKKWGNVSPRDHLTFFEVEVIFEERKLNNLDLDLRGTREYAHLTCCRKCRGILEGLHRARILQFEEASVHTDPGYVGCGI